ncbi:hypothetical protein Scep_013034 [Stephania cephalantha]|uniref:Uncharacterized protein n=1 Tax=Stephania cephalantha TaxID=152367 RepID=A0AAP0JG94_9MAGN
MAETSISLNKSDGQATVNRLCLEHYTVGSRFKNAKARPNCRTIIDEDHKVEMNTKMYGRKRNQGRTGGLICIRKDGNIIGDDMEMRVIRA